MARRIPNPRLAKLRRSYTVEEAARVLGVHENTIRAWLKQGLLSVAGAWPTLILGAELRNFLSRRKLARKRPCPPGHLFCFGCHAPRRPDPDLVEYLPAAAGPGNIQAICPCCTTLMYRHASKAGFEVFRQILLGSEPQAESRIGDRQ